MDFCKGRALKAVAFSNRLTQNIALLIGKWYNVGGIEKVTPSQKVVKTYFFKQTKTFILHGKVDCHFDRSTKFTTSHPSRLNKQKGHSR